MGLRGDRVREPVGREPGFFLGSATLEREEELASQRVHQARIPLQEEIRELEGKFKTAKKAKEIMTGFGIGLFFRYSTREGI